jgi:hypothetical protein
MVMQNVCLWVSKMQLMNDPNYSFVSPYAIRFSLFDIGHSQERNLASQQSDSLPPPRTRAALPALRGVQHLRRIDPSASSTAAPEVGMAPEVRYPARGGDPLL